MSMDVLQRNLDRQRKLMGSGLRIGGHFTGGKNLLAGLSEAMDQSASAMQLFAGNPHRYWASATSEEDRQTFLAATREMYTMVHSVYITNLGENPAERGYNMTKHSLVNQLEWADVHGCDAFVFHPGSAKEADKSDSLDWCRLGLQDVLARYSPDCEAEYQKDRASDLRHTVRLCLENDANPARNRKIGANLDELYEVVKDFDPKRVGIVIDTTHAFAAGHSVEEIIGWVKAHDEWVEAIHFNTPDPDVKQGSGRDRHSSSFVDGAFNLYQLSQLYQAFRHKPLIMEGSPWLPDDLVWLLRWELELKNGGEIESTKLMKSHHLGDIFSLGS